MAFAVQAYRQHEASREAIEWAYEKILKASFKNREKFGFQPPKSGRKTDLKGDQIVSSWHSINRRCEKLMNVCQILSETHFEKSCFSKSQTPADYGPANLQPTLLAHNF